MFKKISFTLVFVLVVILSQSCKLKPAPTSHKNSSPAQSKNNPPEVQQAKQSQTKPPKVEKVKNSDYKQTRQHRKDAFESSPYKPSDSLLLLDFESGKISHPVKRKRDKYDILEVKLPDGRAAPLGLMYEAGNKKDRYAELIKDPTAGTASDNHVLHYWLKNARIPDQKKGNFKGRVQLNLVEIDKKSAFQRYRIYLHPDLGKYRQYPKRNTWFTINELMMGAKWRKHPYPFRISLNIAKPPGVGKPLYFTAGAEIANGGAIKKGKWKQVWGEVGYNFEIPLGEWLDVEIGYKQGDQGSGRFYMGVKREKDKKLTTVFDITNWTYHPESPKPVPMTHWNPLKVYTSSRIIDFVRKNNGTVQIYWDDMEVYDNW